MKVVGIKLVTGEEIIGEVGILNDGTFKVTNPVQIRLVPPQVAGAQPSMGFVPFPAFAEQKSGNFVTLEPLHIVYRYEVDEQISSQYNTVFGSGIITPSKQIITG